MRVTCMFFTQTVDACQFGLAAINHPLWLYSGPAKIVVLCPDCVFYPNLVHVTFSSPAGRNRPATASPRPPQRYQRHPGGYATVGGTDWASSTGTAGNITAYVVYWRATSGFVSLPAAPSTSRANGGAKRAATSAKSFYTLNLTGSLGVSMKRCRCADSAGRRPDRVYFRHYQQRHLGWHGQRGTDRHYASQPHDPAA